MKVCLLSNKYIPLVFAYITSRVRLWSTPVDTHSALDIHRMTGWHPHPHQGPLGAENDCSCSVRATWITFWPGWLVPSVCDGHSFCVNLRPQPWAASVPLFPLQSWHSSTRVKRASNSILWDKGKGQSFERKKKASANLFFFFCLLIFSISQPKGNWKKPLLFPDVLMFLKSPLPFLSAGLNYFLSLENPFSLLTPFTFTG